jgi:integrase
VPYKRCHEKGCKIGQAARRADPPQWPRCSHTPYIYAERHGIIEKGPVTKYAALLDPGQRLPETKQEAEDLEKKLLLWVTQQRRPWTPPPPSSPPPGPAPAPDTKTVNEVIGYEPKTQKHTGWFADHGQHLKDKYLPTILTHLTAAVGKEPFTVLFERMALRDFVDEYRPDDGVDQTSWARYNRHLAYWRNVTYWFSSTEGKALCRALEVPFYSKKTNRYGIKQQKEGNRAVRLQPGWEEAIIQACKDLGYTMLLGRYYCAVDLGLRRGEMLQLRKTDIISDYQGAGMHLRVRFEIAKTATERYVPVHTDRCREFIQDRRFADFTFGQEDGTRVDGFRTEWENVLIQSKLCAGHKEKVYPFRWVWDDVVDLTWHDLRHECGSRLAEGYGRQKGMPLHEVQKWLGHASLATTQKYLNATVQSMATNARRIAKQRGL